MNQLHRKFKEWKYAELACSIAKENGIPFDRVAVMESDLVCTRDLDSTYIASLCIWDLSGAAGSLLRLLDDLGVERIHLYPRKNKRRSILSELRLISCILSLDWWRARRVLVGYTIYGMLAGALLSKILLAIISK